MGRGQLPGQSGAARVILLHRKGQQFCLRKLGLDPVVQKVPCALRRGGGLDEGHEFTAPGFKSGGLDRADQPCMFDLGRIPAGAGREEL